MKTLLFFSALGLLPALAAAQTAAPGSLSAPSTAGVIPLADLGKPMPAAAGTVPAPDCCSKPVPAAPAAGPDPGQVESRLAQLKRMPLYHKYVNYEAVKIMLGVGWGASRPFGGLTATNAEQPLEQDRRFSGRVQLLYPRPLLRNVFPMAFGLTYARSVVAVRQASFVPGTGQLLANPAVEVSRLRTEGLGVVALRVIRLPGLLHAVTVMAGASGEYNLSARLRTRPVTGSDSFRSSRSLRPDLSRWSVPAQVQIGWSRSQFFSLGAYATYDLIPRFKADTPGRMHQMNLGLSAGLII